MVGYLSLAGRILLIGYEKIVVKQLGEKANSAASSLLFFLLATLFLLPVVIIVSPPMVFPPIIVATGAVYSCAFYLYVRALSTSDASLVGPLYNFSLFFLLLLSAVFLGERITGTKVGGLIGLIVGASILNVRKGGGIPFASLFKERGAVLMILCSIFMAVGRTMDGALVHDVHPLWYAFILYAIISGFLLLLTLASKQAGNAVAILRNKPLYAAAAGGVNAYSYVLLLVAFKSLEVSVVEPATMLGTIVTVILARIVFKERIFSRLPGIAMMLVGAILLFL